LRFRPELFTGWRANAGVLRWAGTQRDFAIAAIAVDESIFGLVRRENAALLAAYEVFLQTRCTILTLDEDIARMKLPHRPHRVEPRNLKRRPRNYPLLTKSRAELRATLRSQHDHLVAQVYV